MHSSRRTTHPIGHYFIIHAFLALLVLLVAIVYFCSYVSVDGKSYSVFDVDTLLLKYHVVNKGVLDTHQSLCKQNLLQPFNLRSNLIRRD